MSRRRSAREILKFEFGGSKNFMSPHIIKCGNVTPNMVYETSWGEGLERGQRIYGLTLVSVQPDGTTKGEYTLSKSFGDKAELETYLGELKERFKKQARVTQYPLDYKKEKAHATGGYRAPELSVPERHQLKIARGTLKMPDEIVGVLGGMDKEEARQIIRRFKGRKQTGGYATEIKHKVKEIWLNRAEGPHEECGKPRTVHTFDEANAVLREWALTAPAEGGYDKTDFKITFDDGSEALREVYQGRYDLKHHTVERPDLAKHVRDFLGFYAGTWRPAHLTLKEHQELLKQQPKGGDLIFKRFLNRYDLGQDTSAPDGRTAGYKPGEHDSGQKLLARWATRGGKHWYELYQDSMGLTYHEDGGGGNLGGMTEQAAIKHLEGRMAEADKYDGIHYKRVDGHTAGYVLGPISEQQRRTAMMIGAAAARPRMGGYGGDKGPIDEPWRIAVDKFYDSRKGTPFELGIFEAKHIHREEVEQALAQGKPVPAEVLKDYPELARGPRLHIGVAKGKPETLRKPQRGTGSAGKRAIVKRGPGKPLLITRGGQKIKAHRGSVLRRRS